MSSHPAEHAVRRIAIVYYSGSGHNHALAQAVAEGAGAGPGVQVELERIAGEDITHGRWKNEAVLARLAGAHAIIFGTPTYMGGPAAQFKAFADATGGIWFTRGWKDKLAGGFSHSNSPAGDKANTFNYLAALAAQHGMLWVSQPELPFNYTGRTDGINRFGFYAGAAGATVHSPGQPVVVDPADLVTARAYGRRVAEAAQRWNR